MTVEDRLVEAFAALDPDVRPDATAWAGIERRHHRRPWWRRLSVLLAAAVVVVGGGVGAVEVLAPAGHSDVEVSTGKLTAQEQREAEREAEQEAQQRAEAELTRKIQANAATAVLRTRDWAAAVLDPLGCNDPPTYALIPFTAVVEDVVYSADSGGPAVAVVAARCDANGTPPFGIYVFGLKGDGPDVELRQVILDRKADLHPIADGPTSAVLPVVGDGLSLDLAAYSSDSVTRCCPDQFVTLTWHWSDGQVTMTPRRPISER